MSAFLAEAAALVARKPGELFELKESLIADALAAHGQAPSGPSSLAAGGPGQGSEAGIGFSLLAVAALRQAVRVAGSGKMAPHARAGIAAYVAGALSKGTYISYSPLSSDFQTSCTSNCQCESSACKSTKCEYVNPKS